MAITIDNAVRLPVTVERGASGGPTFDTVVQRTDGGRISTVVNWSLPLYKWDISYGIMTPADFNAVRDVFIGARGAAYGFRFKDWSDYEIPTIVNIIGEGDGVETEFQIYKIYTNTVRTLSRKITRPVNNGSIEVQVAATPYVEGGGGGTGYTVDYSTGIITFNTAPTSLAAIYCKCEFDVPVHFVSDEFAIQLEWAEAGTVPSLQIEEVRE